MSLLFVIHIADGNPGTITTKTVCVVLNRLVPLRSGIFGMGIRPLRSKKISKLYCLTGKKKVMMYFLSLKTNKNKNKFPNSVHWKSLSVMSSAAASHSSHAHSEVSKFHFPIKQYAELVGYMADSRCGAGNKMNVNILFQKAKSSELQLGLCQKDSKLTWISSSWLKMEPLDQDYKRTTVTE